MVHYLAGDALTSKEDAPYELFAVAYHHVNINQGHYWAITRSSTPGQPDECGWFLVFFKLIALFINKKLTFLGWRKLNDQSVIKQKKL